MDIAPWVPCNKCSAPIGFDSSYIEQYFKKDRIECNACKSPVDWWKVSYTAIKNNFMFNQVFSLLEARTKVIDITLYPEARVCLNFSHYDIPTHAKILYVNYTPQGGGLFPIEIHGNVPHRQIINNEIWLYPVPIGNENTASQTKVSVMVTWVEHAVHEIELVNITDACEAYSKDKYLEAIIPANVAVESALFKFLSSYLNGFVGKSRTENFLESAATYSSQLHVVLPLIVKLNELPILSDSIRGALNKLRECRNQIAHTGKTKKDLTKEDVAEMLCAAIFALRYIYMVENELATKT